MVVWHTPLSLSFGTEQLCSLAPFKKSIYNVGSWGHLSRHQMSYFQKTACSLPRQPLAATPDSPSQTGLPRAARACRCFPLLQVYTWGKDREHLRSHSRLARGLQASNWKHEFPCPQPHPYSPTATQLKSGNPGGPVSSGCDFLVTLLAVSSP